MAKLLGLFLTISLLSFAAAPFGLPVTIVAFAGTYEGVDNAVGDADNKILNTNSGPAKRVAQTKTKKVCKRSGGLLGAMNCVTIMIEGAGSSSNETPDSADSTDANTGTTTTSVQNLDGSRTITKTDKDGNVLSKETVGKSPASASSTDQKTGVTTTSVANPDGTRTVTKTDKDGNILSREQVR